MSDTIIVVTATVVNADGETECFSDSVEHAENMQDAIDSAHENAVERFENEDYSKEGMRVFIHVTTMPKPKSLITRIEATLPAQEGSDSVVTATVS